MRIFLLASGMFVLAGCGMVEGQVRDEIVQRCEGVAETARIPASMVTESCECAADKALEDGVTKVDEIDRARIQEIVKDCAAERMRSFGTDGAENGVG